MDISKLKSLIDLVSRSRVSELEIVEGDERIRIVKAASVSPVQQNQAVRPADRPEVPTTREQKPAPSGERLVLSPMYGVFHRAPSPGSPPFVELGQTIEKGQKLGVIEAMKLFNAVEAEIEGVVEAIPVENGQEVEAGQTLFRIG